MLQISLKAAKILSKRFILCDVLAPQISKFGYLLMSCLRKKSSIMMNVFVVFRLRVIR